MFAFKLAISSNEKQSRMKVFSSHCGKSSLITSINTKKAKKMLDIRE